MCSSSGRYVTFIGGLAIGAGIALLFAPAPGAKVRKRLASSAGRYARDVKDQLVDRGEGLLEKGRDIVESQAEQGKEFVATQTQNLTDTAKKAASDAISRQI